MSTPVQPPPAEPPPTEPTPADAPPAHAPAAGSPFSGSLLDDPTLAPLATGAAPAPAARVRAPRRMPAALSRLWSTPRRRGISITLALLVVGLTAFFVLRPKPQPDFAAAPMDDVLDYALLTEDFNRLSIEQRLALLTELVDRFKNMSAGDSAAMAMFAAGIEGRMRKQLERNATLLAADVWDKYAWEYAGSPPEQREEAVEKAFLDLSKTLEAIAGVQNTKTDAERLADARAQAKRDQELFKSGEGPTATQMARMASSMRKAMLENGSPQQQIRGQQLMRDMTRYLRGQDIVTGK